MSTGRTLEAAIAAVLEHGSLFAAGYGRTCTIDGRRLVTIRLQVDVCAAVYDGEPVYYPELREAIAAGVAAWRAARAGVAS